MRRVLNLGAAQALGKMMFTPAKTAAVALPILVTLVLGGCGERKAATAPTDQQAAVAAAQTYDDDSQSAATGAAATSGAGASKLVSGKIGPMRPGVGPTSFVGRWTRDVETCANPNAPVQPIKITPMRFEGLNNSCAIDRITETDVGYQANLTCSSQGRTIRERLDLVTTEDVLRLTYLDRGGRIVVLNKCTTLTETAPNPAPPGAQ